MGPFDCCTTRTHLSALLHPYLIAASEIARMRELSASFTGARRAAATAFLGTLDEIADLRSSSFANRCAEMLQANGLAEASDWGEADGRVATHAAWKVEEFCEEAEAISAAFLGLIALESLERGFDRTAISALMARSDWVVKAEVIARWLWMQHHLGGHPKPAINRHLKTGHSLRS